MYFSRYCVLGALFALPLLGRAATWDLYDGSSGVSCVNYNHAASVPWKNRGSDWTDADGTPQGSKPFSTVAVVAFQTGTVRLNATALLRAPAIVMRRTSSSGIVSFHSRESGHGPRLVLTMSNNSIVTLQAKADSTMAYSGGKCTSLLASPGQLTSLLPTHAAVMSFGAIPSGVVSAALEIDILRSSSPATFGLFALSSPVLPESAATGGISTNYPGDRGIAQDPSVLYFESWDDQPDDWWRRSGYFKPPFDTWAQDGGRFPTHWIGVSVDPTGGALGAALKIVMQATTNGGTTVPGFDFKEMKGREYDEMYVRYYVRFAPDFRDADPCDGGKLPGFASDTSVAGNNGAKVDGTNGWSLRGAYILNCDKTNPIYPKVMLSTYAYHAEMAGFFGDEWKWTGRGELGLAPLNQWQCVEQHLKVNTPGVKDGILQTWVNGKLAMDRRDVLLRKQPPYKVPGNLGIQKFWGTLHNGGKAPFGHNATLWYDQTVIATKRIGCIPGTVGVGNPPPAPDNNPPPNPNPNPPPTGGTDTVKPTVSVTAPLDGAKVTGVVNIRASGSDNVGVARLRVYVGSALMKVVYNVNDLTVDWPTAGLAAGSYQIVAEATDAAGNRATRYIKVTK